MFSRLAMFKGKLSPWDQMDRKLMWKNVQKEAQVCWFSRMLLKPYTSSEILEKSEKYWKYDIGRICWKKKNWCAHQRRGKINSSMLITLNHAGWNQVEAMTTSLCCFLWLNTKLTCLLSTKEYENVRKNWLENLTNCWDVTFDELQLYMYSCNNTPVVTNDITL